MHFLRCLPLALVAAVLTSDTFGSGPQVEAPPDLLIGYTQFRTDVPGGRYVNEWTMRAVVVSRRSRGAVSAFRGRSRSRSKTENRLLHFRRSANFFGRLVGSSGTAPAESGRQISEKGACVAWV